MMPSYHSRMSVSVPVIVIDAKLIVLDLNSRAEKLLCCSKSLLLGHCIQDIFRFHWANFPFTSEDLAFSQENERGFITSFKQHGAKDKRIQWRIKKFSDQEKSEISYLLEAGDENEEKIANNTDPFANAIVERVSQTVQHSNSSADLFFMLNQIIQCLPGCAHIKHHERFIYQHANMATLELLGMKDSRELLGKDDYDLAKYMRWRWPSQFAQDLQDYDFSVMHTKQAMIDVEEKPYLNIKGVLVMNSLTKIPLFTSAGEPLGVLTCAIDRARLKKPVEIRKLYQELYLDRKIGHENFIRHIGLDKYLQGNSMITERELDYLIAYCKGKTAKEVARVFDISPRTFEKSLELLKTKFGGQKRSDLTTMFMSLNLIQ